MDRTSASQPNCSLQLSEIGMRSCSREQRCRWHLLTCDVGPRKYVVNEWCKQQEGDKQQQQKKVKEDYSEMSFDIKRKCKIFEQRRPIR